MNKQFLKKIKDKLSKEKSEVIRKLSNLDLEIDSDGDEADEIQANLAIYIADSLNSKQKLYVNEINKALLKIEEGVYGICEECEEEISEKRLEYNPHFNLCVRCAEVQEKERKGHAF